MEQNKRLSMGNMAQPSRKSTLAPNQNQNQSQMRPVCLPTCQLEPQAFSLEPLDGYLSTSGAEILREIQIQNRTQPSSKIRSLSKRDYSCFLRNYLLNHSYNELAGITGVKRKTKRYTKKSTQKSIYSYDQEMEMAMNEGDDPYGVKFKAKSLSLRKSRAFSALGSLNFKYFGDDEFAGEGDEGEIYLDEEEDEGEEEEDDVEEGAGGEPPKRKTQVLEAFLEPLVEPDFPEPEVVPEPLLPAIVPGTPRASRGPSPLPVPKKLYRVTLRLSDYWVKLNTRNPICHPVMLLYGHPEFGLPENCVAVARPKRNGMLQTRVSRYSIQNMIIEEDGGVFSDNVYFPEFNAEMKASLMLLTYHDESYQPPFALSEIPMGTLLDCQEIDGTRKLKGNVTINLGDGTCIGILNYWASLTTLADVPFPGLTFALPVSVAEVVLRTPKVPSVIDIEEEDEEDDEEEMELKMVESSLGSSEEHSSDTRLTFSGHIDEEQDAEDHQLQSKKSMNSVGHRKSVKTPGSKKRRTLQKKRSDSSIQNYSEDHLTHLEEEEDGKPLAGAPSTPFVKEKPSNATNNANKKPQQQESSDDTNTKISKENDHKDPKEKVKGKSTEAKDDSKPTVEVTEHKEPSSSKGKAEKSLKRKKMSIAKTKALGVFLEGKPSENGKDKDESNSPTDKPEKTSPDATTTDKLAPESKDNPKERRGSKTNKGLKPEHANTNSPGAGVGGGGGGGRRHSRKSSAGARSDEGPLLPNGGATLAAGDPKKKGVRRSLLSKKARGSAEPQIPVIDEGEADETANPLAMAAGDVPIQIHGQEEREATLEGTLPHNSLIKKITELKENLETYKTTAASLGVKLASNKEKMGDLKQEMELLRKEISKLS